MAETVARAHAAIRAYADHVPFVTPRSDADALAAASFGAFVAAIPSPLGIGTLNFTDGTSAKGFLVEAEAVKAAPDITASGGWRAFVSAPR